MPVVEPIPETIASGTKDLIASVVGNGTTTMYSTNSHCTGGIQINGPEAWCSAEYHDLDEYVQIMEKSAVTWKAIETQGRLNADQWVEEYKLKTSVDGVTWTDYNGGQAFQANHDRNTRVVNYLDPPISAMGIRLHPIGFNNWMSMRLEAYFMPAEITTEDPTTSYNPRPFEIVEALKEFLTQFGSDVTFTLLEDLKSYDITLNVF